MATRVTQETRIAAAGLPASNSTALATQVLAVSVAAPPASLTAAEATQVVWLAVATYNPTAISVYPATLLNAQTFPPVTVTVPAPPVANPPGTGGPVVTVPPPPEIIYDWGPEFVYDGTPASPPPAPTPSPSTPPVVSGPGGGEGIGGSGVGVGVGIGGGIGPGISPAESPPAVLPVDPSFLPQVPVIPDKAPPYQLLPKSAIPPEMNRVPMPAARPANEYDQELYRQTGEWAGFLAGPGSRALSVGGGLSGLSGLGSLGSSTQAGWNQTRSLDTYRRGSRGLEREFFERGGVITPGPGPDVVVVDWVVPTGYEARIYAYYCIYTGTGFVQGSGDIIWGLRAGLNWVRNMGGLLYAVGSLANPFPVQDYTAVKPNQRVTFQVNVPNISGLIQVGASRILCGVQGWLFPITRRVEENERGR